MVIQAINFSTPDSFTEITYSLNTEYILTGHVFKAKVIIFITLRYSRNKKLFSVTRMRSRDIKVAYKACLLLMMHVQMDLVLVAASQGMKLKNNSELVISGSAS